MIRSPLSSYSLLTPLSGTEQDRVNCSFYLKIGACRHGDRCSRKHIHPQYSQTILLPNVYNNPIHTPEGQNMSAEELQANFDRFYEDFFIELAKYGHLLEMHVSERALWLLPMAGLDPSHQVPFIFLLSSVAYRQCWW
jgi:hypothetical protein